MCVVHLVYEKRFKRMVPFTRPDYIWVAYECYTKKLEESNKVGKVCNEMDTRNCRLEWLCFLFEQAAFYGSLKTLSRSMMR